MRMLASLSGLTYFIGTKVTPRALMRRHRLELISTSLACERMSFQPEAGAREAVEEGDGCCMSLLQAREIYGDRGDDAAEASAAAVAGGARGGSSSSSSSSVSRPEPGTLHNVVPFARPLAGSSASADQQRHSRWLLQQQQQIATAQLAALEAATLAGGSSGNNGTTTTSSSTTTTSSSSTPVLGPASTDTTTTTGGGMPTATTTSSSSSGGPATNGSKGAAWKPTDLVAAKLGEVAAAASSATLAPLASAASAAGAAALAPIASAAGSLGVVSSRLFPSATSMAAAAPSQQQLPDRLAGAAIAGAAMEVAAADLNGRDAACPSEWFVADDARTHTRYFIIQGSDSLDHWKTNVLFEPVVFEDPAFGIRVSRPALRLGTCRQRRSIGLT
jgi:hypothetical protein